MVGAFYGKQLSMPVGGDIEQLADSRAGLVADTERGVARVAGHHAIAFRQRKTGDVVTLEWRTYYVASAGLVHELTFVGTHQAQSEIDAAVESIRFPRD